MSKLLSAVLVLVIITVLTSCVPLKLALGSLSQTNNPSFLAGSTSLKYVHSSTSSLFLGEKIVPYYHLLTCFSCFLTTYDTKMCTTLHVYFTKKKIRFIGKSYTGNRPIVARRMYMPKVPSPLRVKLNRAQSGLITVHKGISSPNIFIELGPAALYHLPKN